MEGVLELRAASAADARAIAEIHVAGWRAAYRGLMPDAQLDALSVEQRASFWTRTLSLPAPSRVIVAGDAGFCSYGPTRDAGEQDDVAEIYALYVMPDCWRRGIGRALCGRAVTDAASRSCSAMALWVLVQNGLARRFYEALGFAADGTQRNNEIRYRKLLD